MKKSLRLIALTGILTLSVPVVLGMTSNAKKVDAYTPSSLPTTIDLNDSSAANIRSYYSGLDNKSQSELTGTNLLKNLKPILKQNQKYLSYDSGNSIWDVYCIVDRDWVKSPATSLPAAAGTYNSSTNKITNYNWGDNSSTYENPYLHILYFNRDKETVARAYGDHGNKTNNPTGINREHIWPKGAGFDTNGSGGARGDIMHLWAAHGHTNNKHSNFYYGYVDTTRTYKDEVTDTVECAGNLLGYSKTFGGTTSVFEPQDCDKGDIARACFYMVARYNNLAGDDNNIDSNNPNLELVNNITSFQSNGYTSSSSSTGKLGILQDLLEWNRMDPPDEFEIHRNNLCYNNFTSNRNPFIDFPEWAEYIWGKSTNGSYSSNPTGSAAPTTDTINDFSGGGTTVSVTGVSLNKNSTSVSVGGEETLAATIAPSNATNKTVTWTSSNPNVATVASGLITGVSEGSTTITATTQDGGFTASCTVTVTASPTPGPGTSVDDILFAKGFGGNTAGSYSAAGTDYTGVANSTNVSGSSYAMQVFNGSTGAIRGNRSGAANFSLRNTTIYSNHYISKIELDVTGTNDYSLGNSNGRSLVYFGSSAYANPNNTVPSGTGTTGTLTNSNHTLTWTNADTSCNYFILYNLETSNTCLSESASSAFTITWTPVSASTKTLSSISLDTSDTQTSFSVGESFNYDELVVTANYDDGSSDIVIPTSVSTPNTSTAGQKTVTVTYTENGVTKTATYTITVNAVTLQSIEVSNPKTSYYVGDEFVKPTVTATYSNGSTSDVTNSATFTGYNLSTAGNQTVTVSYTNVITQTTSYNITVTAVTVTSLDVSNPKTIFTVGDTFSFGGTVTAHYNNGSTADVTPSATFSGYNMSTVGNQTVTVSFGGQSTTYQITVNNSGGGGTDTTKYALINSTSDLEAGKSYIITNGTSGSVYAMAVTSNTANRKTTSATVTSGKITRGSTILSVTLGGTSGAWTFATENYAGDAGYLASCDASGTSNYLRVISTAGTATISFNGDAAVITIGPHASRNIIRYNPNNGNPIFACYSSGQQAVYLWKEVSDSTLSSISLNTDNVQTVFSVGDTFNYSGLVVTAHYSDSSSAVVTPTSVSSPNMSTAGQKTVTVTYTEDGVSKTANYTITVSSSPSISWTSPSIDAYSGSTLSGTDVNGWAVTYNDGAGHQTVLTYNQLTVKLGGETISIPHTWLASDDGKTLTATYNGLTTTNSSGVVITQSVNSINASITSNYDYTFESQQYSSAGSATLGGHSWTQAGTGDGFWGYDDNYGRGQQFGKAAAPYSTLSLTCSDFSGTINSVTIYTSGAKDVEATVQVKVGGTSYGNARSITSTNTGYTFSLGGKSGTIVISWSQTSEKALYVKEIVVNSTYTGNIANSDSHKAAQRAAVKFANAFNAAMATTQYCTTNMSSAWSTCASAYNTFKSEAAALGTDEEAYAKNLIKYATAQYSDDSGEACIERMMKTYEICVSQHGQTAFMNDLVSVSKVSNSPITIVNENTNNLAIIAIVTAFGIVIVGGYFFIRKKKYQ